MLWTSAGAVLQALHAGTPGAQPSPGLVYTRVYSGTSLLLLFAWRSYWTAHVDTTVSIFLLLFRRLEDLEGAQQGLIDTHHRAGIVEFTTVVWRREQRDKLPLSKELVAVFDNLVRAADEVHVVLGQEARHNVGTKRERDTAVVLGPARDVLVRIRPEQVAQETRVGHISGPHHATNLLHALQVGRETTMHCEDLFVDDCCNWQAVEAVGKCLPELDVEASLAFIVKSVNAIDTCTLVVTTQDEEVFRVLDLVCKEQADGL